MKDTSKTILAIGGAGALSIAIENLYTRLVLPSEISFRAYIDMLQSLIAMNAVLIGFTAVILVLVIQKGTPSLKGILAISFVNIALLMLSFLISVQEIALVGIMKEVIVPTAGFGPPLGIMLFALGLLLAFVSLGSE